MKYKIGNKIRIKKWKEMKRERDSSAHIGYIKSASSDNIIECLTLDYKEPEPIHTRFEILDIR